MAYTKLEDNATITHRQYFLIDSADDLEVLETQFDCEQGDQAELPNGTIYKRHSDGFDGDLWEVIEKTGSSGGSEEEGSEENNLFITNISLVAGENTNYSGDKTLGELTEAFHANKIIIVIASVFSNVGDTLPIQRIVQFPNYVTGTFNIIEGGSNIYRISGNSSVTTWSLVS